jgi:hypothetical protein
MVLRRSGILLKTQQQSMTPNARETKTGCTSKGQEQIAELAVAKVLNNKGISG